MDSPAGYGIVSRMLHWLMAACFAWHFAGALLYVTVPEAGVTKFVGSTHFTMGFTLLVLVLLRGAWGLLNIRRRPPHPGRLGRLATMGHLVLYLLMILVPGLALLRQYGSGEPFTPYGIPVMSGFEGKIAWMTAPGDLLHSFLGWVLLALILGHVAMALVHRYAWHDDVLGLMTRGRRRRVKGAPGRLPPGGAGFPFRPPEPWRLPAPRPRRRCRATVPAAAGSRARASGRLPTCRPRPPPGSCR